MAPAHRHPGDVGITSPDHRPTPAHRGRGMETAWRSFASDNYAGPHPDVLAAVAASTAGHAGAYGDDDVTARLDVAVKREFGPAAEAFPTFNGTGANVVALASLVRGRGAVVCADTAHVHVDEGGRSGGDRRAQALDGPHARRQAHPRARRCAGLGLRRRAPRPSCRRLDHAVHGIGHGLQPC